MIKIRCDDTFVDTDVEAVQRIWELIHQFPFPHMITVTPMGRGDPLHRMKPLKRGNQWMLKATGKDCITENQPLIDLINHYKDMGDKLAIHGLYHIDHRKLSLSQQRRHLSKAKSILETLFGEVNYFVPPFNKSNDDTVKICDELGLTIIPSYYEADVKIINNKQRSLTKTAEEAVKHGNFAYHPYWLQGGWRADSFIINSKKFNMPESKWNLDEALVRLRRFMGKLPIKNMENANREWVESRFIKRGASDIYNNPVDHEIRKWFYSEVRKRGLKSVLDVGCGQGQDSYPLIENGVTYMGVDPIMKNLERARRRWENADFRFGYIQDLDFTDDSFDCVWMMSVWESLPKDTMQRGIEECCRVARKYVINVDAGYPPGWFEERKSYIPDGWEAEFIKVRDEAKDKYFTIWLIKRL